MTLSSKFALIISIILAGCDDWSESFLQTIEVDKLTPKPTTLDTLILDGNYRGVIPFADRQDTMFTVKINRDGTYKAWISYLGKFRVTLIRQGNVKWDKTGQIMTILNHAFFVSDDKLFFVNESGEPSLNGENYIYSLTKFDGL